MCGRYALIADGPGLAKALAAQWTSEEESKATQPNWNISPSQLAPVVRYPRQLSLGTWGFESHQQGLHINARSETVAEKPTFRTAFSHQRALVPLSGWYEWTPGQKIPKSVKSPPQPYWIYAPERPLLMAAALWTPTSEGFRFTIITAAASETTSHLHPRTPLLLRPEEARAWLHTQTQLTTLKDLLRTPEIAVTHHPVSMEVNAANAQGEHLIAPIRLVPPLL